MSEIKFGLCKLPEPIYLYVNSGESEGKNYLWYYYDIDSQKAIPEYQNGICGIITELRLTEKSFKGKENLKLDIVINADETYIIRTGIETNFAKSFLLSASLVKDFSKPLIVGCRPGEENVVFSSIYLAETKTRVKAEWNAQANFLEIAKNIQGMLGSQVAETKVNPIQDIPNPKDLEIKGLRTMLNYPVEDIKEYLRHFGVKQPSQLKHEDFKLLIKNMCLQWALDKFEHPTHAENSFNHHVAKAVESGVSYAAAIEEWMTSKQEAMQNA